MKKYVVALLLSVTAQPALAASLELFREGRFADAASAGRAEATPASLVLAGRSTLTIASFQVTDKAKATAMVEAAERDFDAALAKAPNNLEAALQKATAIGYRAKLTQSRGLAKETRTRFEAVLAKEPNNGLAWASVAGWHAGSVATLGRFVAGAVLGAKLDTAIRDFDTALAKDPKNPVHRVFYAFSLLDLDPANAPKAAALLREAGGLPARDGFEALLKRNTAQVLPLLDRGDVKAAQAQARRLLPFGTVV